MIKYWHNKIHDVAITFKPGEPQRADIEGAMCYREYRRLVRMYHAGRQSGTFAILLENTPAEVTFPLAEIDTIHAVEAANDDK